MSGTGMRPWGTLAAALGIAAAVLLGFRWLGGHLPAAASSAGAALLDLLFTLALFGTLAAVALLAMRRAGLIDRAAGPRPAGMAGLGAGVGIGALLAAFLYARIAGVAVAMPSGLARGLAPVLLGTIAVVVQGGAEELFFRGWLQRALARDWPPAAALPVVATAFALLHLLGGARAPMSLLNIFLAGLVFGLLAWRTGGLAAPVAAHAGYNWAETLLLGLDPNPGTGSFGALFDFDLVGPAAWGGSSEGLNASVGLLFVLAALVVPLVLLPRPATPAAGVPA